ncbi:MAG: DUF2085 domain-containing protein [Pyrinomonadaceae bacterium]
MPLSATDYRPQVAISRRAWLSWSIMAGAALLFSAAIVGAPMAVASHHSVLAFTLYAFFAKVCHQLPERSFYIAGHQFAVCARCTGLYVGFAATVLLYPLFSSLKTANAPARKWLLIAAVPMAVDFSLTFFGLWENTHTSRLLTGLLLGSMSALFIVPGIVELSVRESAGEPQISQAGLTNVSRDLAMAAPSDYSAPERRI